MYQNYYPDGDFPVATEIQLGDQNAWFSSIDGNMSGTAIPAGVYGQIRVTAIRVGFTSDAHLVGFVTVTGGGEIVVPEGQTVLIDGPVDSAGLTFVTQDELVLIVAADTI